MSSAYAYGPYGYYGGPGYGYYGGPGYGYYGGGYAPAYYGGYAPHTMADTDQVLCSGLLRSPLRAVLWPSVRVPLWLVMAAA